MGHVNDREFMEELIATQMAEPIPNEDPIFKKYANKKLPGTANRGTSYLTQYTGQWTAAEVIHLLRRTTFGIKPADISTLSAMTMDAAVDYLFSNASSTAPAPPVNNYETATYT